MKKRLAGYGLICLVALSGCGSSSGTSKGTATPTPPGRPGALAGSKMTVGLVTDVGGLNDKSFNHDANLGMRMAEQQYGVRGRVIESKTPAAYVPNLNHFAQHHTGLTIAVGFLMQSAIYQMAKAYPNERFAIIDGVPTDAHGNVSNLPNVANLFFKEQESGFLVGVIAGLMEKKRIGKAVHNTIGCMGGLSIPPVDRYIAGYYAGAHRVNPSVSIVRGYAQGFTDQSAGNNIGRTQIDQQHADILFQVAGAAGLGYLAAAQQSGVYGIGADTNQGYLGSFLIASAIKRVEAAVKETIRAAQTGHFQGGDHRFSLINGGTGFTVSSKVIPPEIVAVARQYERKIASGKIVPPTTVPR